MCLQSKKSVSHSDIESKVSYQNISIYKLGEQMANGRNPGARGSGIGRISGRFIALPVVVMDCPNYQKLTANARSLLLEVARQFNLGNNGRLLISRAYLLKRGWKSNDMISKGKKEFQTPISLFILII